ncbi:MAG: YncE family protein [Nitrososphaera sp.]
MALLSVVTISVAISGSGLAKAFAGGVVEIAFGPNVNDIELNPATNSLYVATSNSVVVLDGSTNNIIANLTFGFGFHQIAVSPSTNKVYFTNAVQVDRPGYSADHHISIVDGRTNQLIRFLNISGQWPLFMAVNPHTDEVYLSNGTSSIYILDGKSDVISSSFTPSIPSLLVVDPAVNILYAVGSDGVGAVTVTRLNGSTHDRVGEEIELGPTSAGSSPIAAAYNPDMRLLYIATLDKQNRDAPEQTIPSGFFYVVDTSNNGLELVASIEMYFPIDIALDNEAGRVYVADRFRGVFVIDGRNNEIIATEDEFNNPTSISFNPASGSLFVAHQNTGIVLSIPRSEQQGHSEIVSVRSEVDGNEYAVQGLAQNVTVKSFSIKPHIGIELILDPQASQGSLDLILSKEMIDGIYGVEAFSPSESTILQFKRTENETSSTVSFVVPADTSRVQINAAEVIPEFNPGPIMIASVAAAATLSFVRFRRYLVG